MRFIGDYHENQFDEVSETLMDLRSDCLKVHELVEDCVMGLLDLQAHD